MLARNSIILRIAFEILSLTLLIVIIKREIYDVCVRALSVRNPVILIGAVRCLVAGTHIDPL